MSSKAHPNADKTKLQATDMDLLRRAYQFVPEDEEEGGSDAARAWEKRLVKRYDEQLYKEYCVADLSQYRQGKCGLRWRTAKEVKSGKGETTCGNLSCDAKEALGTYEVNFAYKEQKERKSALVKLKACPRCAVKLNWKKRKREGQQQSSDATEKRPTLTESPAPTQNEALHKPAKTAPAENHVMKAEDEWKKCFETMFG